MLHKIQELHRKKIKIYFAITGGGTGAICEFLRHGGASSVFEGAITPYSEKSLTEFLGLKPKKACSEVTAVDMARTARVTSIYLGSNPKEAVGVGVSCSLAKANERAGRQHHAYITVTSEDFTSIYNLDFTGLKLTREEEETKVAEEIINTLHNHCLVFPERE